LTPYREPFILLSMVNFFKLLSLAALGLWLFGCASTPSPAFPSSQSGQPGQTAQQSRTAAQKDAGKEQKVPQNSGSGQEGSRAVAGGNQGQSATEQSIRTRKEAGQEKIREESPLSRPAEGDTPVTGPQALEQNEATPGEDSQMSFEQQLAEAENNLRISEETEKRIAEELQALKNTGSASPATIANYEIYHESVQAIVTENRTMVEKMKAAKAGYLERFPPSAATGKRHDEATGAGGRPASKANDVSELDRQLQASMNDFDAKLMQEMETIRRESSERMRYLAQEAAEAAKRIEESGGDADVSGYGSSTGSGARDMRTGGGRLTYEDDDIVARQLREAAEKETDPELKEKLWKEYYEYKKNQRASQE